jgi:hypothetical protein
VPLKQRPVAQDLPCRTVGRDLPVVQQQNTVARLEHEVKIQHKDGTEEWLKGFDYIVLGLGSRKYDPLSEELKAFVPEVHVIGDAIKPGQSSDAMHQGFHVGYEL